MTNNTCGAAISGRFCGRTRAAIAPITPVRLGQNVTASFTSTPNVTVIGLSLDATTGTISGTPNASGQFTFTLTGRVESVASKAGGAALQVVEGDVRQVDVVIEVHAPCPVDCGPNALQCNTWTGTLDGTCVCRGLFTTTNASYPCTATPCNGTATLDAATATACVCPNPLFSAESGCVRLACPYHPDTNEICGRTIHTALVRSNNGGVIDGSKACVVQPSGGSAACHCAFPYTFNATTRMCDPLCDTNATIETGGGVCSCDPSIVPMRDPASGCRLPWCYRGASFLANRSACDCSSPFNGTSCAGSASRCECADCVYGTLSCQPTSLYATTCANGSTPACVCNGVAFGRACEHTYCDTTLGAWPSTSGDTCRCAPSDTSGRHAYGGRFCNESLCGPGTPAPVTDPVTGLVVHRCVCPPGYDPTDPFCSRSCITNARRNAAGVCVCDFGWGGPSCNVNLCATDVAAGRYGAGVVDPRKSASCACPLWWRGAYCNVSACGALGAPIPSALHSLSVPDGCTCIPGVALFVSAAVSAGSWGCISVNNCGGGSVNPNTGGCVCGPSNPLCTQPAVTPVSGTASPTRAPTSVPTSTRAPTPTPAPAPSTSPPITCKAVGALCTDTDTRAPPAPGPGPIITVPDEGTPPGTGDPVPTQPDNSGSSSSTVTAIAAGASVAGLAIIVYIGWRCVHGKRPTASTNK